MLFKRKQTLSVDDTPLKSEKQRRNEIDLEALRLQRKSTSKVKVLLVVLLIVGIISPIITMRIAANTEAFTDMASEQFHLVTANKPGRQAALQNVNKWLTASDTPFQSGYANLWWVDAQHVNTITSTSGGNAGSGTQTQYWSHQLSFTDLSDGATRNIAQLVAVSDGVASAVGNPSILPLPSDGSASQTSYMPDEEARIDQAATLKDVVNAWAKAYTGKDPSALTVLVGDPDTNHAYQPACVGTFKSASVDWLIAVDGEGAPVKAKDGAAPKYGAASLTIQFSPYPKKGDLNADEQRQASSVTSTMSVGVLIADPSSGSARIVDWNAAGVVSKLRPYANAVSKEQLVTANASETDDVAGATAQGGAASPTSGAASGDGEQEQ